MILVERRIGQCHREQTRSRSDSEGDQSKGEATKASSCLALALTEAPGALNHLNPQRENEQRSLPAKTTKYLPETDLTHDRVTY
jgi:hypothetical protein